MPRVFEVKAGGHEPNKARRYHKAHFEDVARVLSQELSARRRVSDLSGTSALMNVTFDLAELFKKHNPKFDRDLFFKAVTGTNRQEV